MKMRQQFFISACLVIAAGCYKDSDFDPLALEPDEVIVELRASPDVLSANGSAISNITAVLPDGGQENLDMTFTTSAGLFVENGTKVLTVKTKAVQYPEGILVCANATLRNSNATGRITLNASFGGYEVSKTLTSVENPAAAITVVVPSLVLSNNPASEMEVITQLSAASGTVSQGQLVGMQVLDESLVPRGTFRLIQDRSDQEGKCKFVFSIAPDTLFTGPLSFRANTQISSGTIEANRTIYITN